MASPQSPGGAALASGGGGIYKRASRKGAPRRFTCDYPGCDKMYSRAEHLQRHQLNHNPREIYRCDVPGCDQKFVRADLLARHKKRHTSSYVPRNRVPSFSNLREQDETNGHDIGSPDAAPLQRPVFSQPQPPAGPHDAAILLTPESNVAPPPSALANSLPSRLNQGPPPVWSPPPLNERTPVNLMRPKLNFYSTEAPTLPEPEVMAPFPAMNYSSDEQLAQDNFATWLFDPQTNYNDFSMTSLPFLEAGLESTFNNDIQYDYESLTSRSQMGLTPPNYFDVSDELMTEARRQEILHWFQVFRQKKPRYEALITNIVHESGGDLPALNLEMMRDCLREFWDAVSPRLPVVHQHTFPPNRSPIMLVLVMVALGAASRRNRDMSGQLTEYGAFADVIMSSVRWEILTSDDATPPISLWVAQALLLLEFYEKLYSSRKFHERAHIYHSSFLTLLRRGSPLIGRAGSESPPEPDQPESDRHPQNMSLDSRTWWIRWAETESMHRVVFGAFMLDILHAAMFGHVADMAPHEIRLPLPCDDNLWTASSPDVVRQLDANLRMYGVKQVSFLDGLKSALHGKEVKTHSFGRMIIMSGLLSVGWHLSHRETHLKWLDLRTSSSETRDQWRKMLLPAFDNWKDSFDRAMSDSVSDGSNARCGANGPMSSASLIYHLAHLSLHVDIMDCQVFAGMKRLVGRRVSSRDYTNAVKRMSNWAKLASTRQAILHAFKLLHQVFVQPQSRRRNGQQSSDGFAVHYSVRNEVDPHRPWTMYYAVLSIWSFVQAIGRPAGRGYPILLQSNTYTRMAEYLSNVAALTMMCEYMGLEFACVRAECAAMKALEAAEKQKEKELSAIQTAQARLREIRRDRPEDLEIRRQLAPRGAPQYSVGESHSSGRRSLLRTAQHAEPSSVPSAPSQSGLQTFHDATHEFAKKMIPLEVAREDSRTLRYLYLPDDICSSGNCTNLVALNLKGESSLVCPKHCCYARNWGCLNDNYHPGCKDRVIKFCMEHTCISDGCLDRVEFKGGALCEYHAYAQRFC
ncbi:Fc.00g048540.m01.CDS01 [Cosmosporella sp. VM-42]